MIVRNLVFIAIIVGSVLIGYFVGFRTGRNGVFIEEYKVFSANVITLRERPEDSALKQFTKAEFYYFANRIPMAYFPRNADFGPIQTESISNLVIGKGPISAGEEYQRFTQRKKSFQ